MPVTQCLVSTAGAIFVAASWRVWRVHPGCALLVALAVAFLGPACAVAAEVTARFSLEQPGAGPFPSNLFTIADPRQYTGRRVHLPLPPCAARPSDCDDLDLINTLDGFNLQPRLSIPFSGPIAIETVTSATVFLLKLASTRDMRGYSDAGRVAERLIGINQVVWDPQTSTLHVEWDALLDQHTLYALIVTRGVRDLEGEPVQASSAFTRFLLEPATFDLDADGRAYRELLLHAMMQADFEGVVRPRDIAVMSVFTTQSATVTLESIRDQIKAAPPTPATFLLGPGTMRTVFALAEVADITWRQQVGADASDPAAFEQQRVRLDLLSLVPNAVQTIAFGAYRAPDYQTAAGIIPPPGIGVGSPMVQGHHEVFFTLFLPTGQQPTSGWPVAIVGPSRGASKNSSTAYSLAAPVAYAPHLRKTPRAGVPAKSVLIQLARGDRNFPNPTTTAILRAGALADRATFYRHDGHAGAAPHGERGADTGEPTRVHAQNHQPGSAGYCPGGQQQMAEFLATDGSVVIDPDGQEGALFEVPMGLPLPEDLGFRR